MRKKHSKDQKHAKQGFIAGSPRFGNGVNYTSHPKRTASYQRRLEYEAKYAD